MKTGNEQLSHHTLRRLFADSLRCRARWMNRAFEEISLEELPQGIRYERKNKRPIADIFEINLSWSSPKPTIYEVKASRADFHADVRAGKYLSYLPFCERLYFVFPKGMIKKHEIPPEAGGIRWDNEAETGKRRIIKRAPNQKVVLPLGVLWQCLLRASDPGTYQPMKEERRLNALQCAAKFALDRTHEVHYTAALVELQDINKSLDVRVSNLDYHIRELARALNVTLLRLPDARPSFRRRNSWYSYEWAVRDLLELAKQKIQERNKKELDNR